MSSERQREACEDEAALGAQVIVREPLWTTEQVVGLLTAWGEHQAAAVARDRLHGLGATLEVPEEREVEAEVSGEEP